MMPYKAHKDGCDDEPPMPYYGSPYHYRSPYHYGSPYRYDSPYHSGPYSHRGY